MTIYSNRGPSPAFYGYGGPPQPPASLGRKQGTRAVNVMAFLLLVQFVVSFLLTIVITAWALLGGVNLLGDQLTYLVYTAFLVPLSTALPFLVYLFVSKADWTEFLRFQRVGVSTALLCVLGGTGVCMLANFPAMFIQSFFSQFGYEPGSSPFVSGTLGELLLELSITAFLVPVMEEFAFRGVLFSRLRRHGKGFAIVGSALLFSLAHLDFSSVVFAFIAGLVFGFLYERTRNLWVTIFIHVINNGVAVLTGNTDLLFGAERGELVGNLLFFGTMLLGVVAVVLLLVFKRPFLFGREGAAVATGTPGQFGAWSSPLGEVPHLSPGESLRAMVCAPVLWVAVGGMLFYTFSLFQLL